MRTIRTTAMLVAGAVVFAACGGDVFVTAERSDQARGATPPATAPPVTTSTPDIGLTDPPVNQAPTTQVPESTAPASPPAPADLTAIDFGPNKPAREYDELLLAPYAFASSARSPSSPSS
jgi:hypothetical protein